MTLDPRERLIVALDVASVGEAQALVERLGAAVSFYKIGYQLAVTVLTSYDDADLAAAGYDFTVPELVAERAAQARDIGIDGLVCAAEEAVRLRALIRPSMVLVTPGIRPAGAAA